MQYIKHTPIRLVVIMPRYFRNRWLFALLFSLCTLTKTLCAETLTFGAIEGLSEQKVGALVLKQVYLQLGIDVQVIPLPARRAESLLHSGKLDGEVMRIHEYESANASAIVVPTPYYAVTVAAFVRKNSQIAPSRIEDLKRHSIVRIRGVKNTELMTKGFQNVLEESDTESALRLVLRGKVNVALTSRVNGLLSLNRMGESQLVAFPIKSSESEVFHFLHKRHKTLVPKVDAIIRRLRKSGELETMIKDAEIKVIGDFEHDTSY